MGEIIPVVIGAVVAVIVGRIPAARVRWIAWAVLAVVGGVLATVISSEAVESWAFALVDIAIVGAVAAIGYGLLHLAYRRFAQSR